MNRRRTTSSDMIDTEVETDETTDNDKSKTRTSLKSMQCHTAMRKILDLLAMDFAEKRMKIYNLFN